MSTPYELSGVIVLGNNIVVRIVQGESRTASGVIATTSTSTRLASTGEVVAVGPGRGYTHKSNQLYFDTGIKVGDVVHFTVDAGEIVPIHDPDTKVGKDTTIEYRVLDASRDVSLVLSRNHAAQSQDNSNVSVDQLQLEY